MLNLPNILTISRIAAAPVLVVLFYIPGAWAAWTALGVYIAAAATDYFDGMLARRYNQVSPLGKFLDPISDKIFVAAILMLLAGFDRLEGVWLIPAVVILMREFLIAGLREFLGPANIELPVSKLAKWKTGVQMVAIGFLVIGPYGEAVLPMSHAIGQWGLLAAAILTVVTGWDYLQAGIKHIKNMS